MNFFFFLKQDIFIFKFVSDINYKVKLLHGPSEGTVESCKPNPCINGGKCASSSNKKSCQCIGHFTGKALKKLIFFDSNFLY